MPRLILMRHAKSDRANHRGADRARPLNPRGTAAATTMGRLLSAIGETPDVVVSSPAVRAESTAELARIAGGWHAPLVLDDRLYDAGPAGALSAAHTHGAQAARILVVGHEPTWSLLTRHLTGAAVAMRTATVVGIDLPDGWEPEPMPRGSISYVLQPRLFEGFGS